MAEAQGISIGVELGTGIESLIATIEQVNQEETSQPTETTRPEKVGPDGILPVRLAKVGKFVHPGYGEFTLTAEDLKTIADNFAPCSIDYDHNSRFAALRSATPRAGEIISCEPTPRPADKNGEVWLWGMARFTEQARRFINADEYAYASPYLIFNGMDEQGNKVGPKLQNYAITNNPFWKGLSLSNGYLMDQELYREEPAVAAIPLDTEEKPMAEPIQAATAVALGDEAPPVAVYNAESGRLIVTLEDGTEVPISIPEGFRLIPNDEPIVAEEAKAEDEQSKDEGSPEMKDEKTASAEQPEVTVAKTVAASAIAEPSEVELSIVKGFEKTLTDLAESIGNLNGLVKVLQADVNEVKAAHATTSAATQTTAVQLSAIQEKQFDVEIETIFTEKRVRPAIREMLKRTAKVAGTEVMLSDLATMGDFALVDISEYGAGAKTENSVVLSANTFVDQKLKELKEQKQKGYKEAMDIIRNEHPREFAIYVNTNGGE